MGVVALMALIALLTFRDYGVSLDESYHLTYGFYIIRFYGSGFSDHTAVTYRIDYLYGGGFDATGMIFRSWTRAFLNRYEAIHLFGSLIGVLGVAGAGRLARLLGGSRAGFIAVCVLGTTSVYYGHMFNNPKDLPFAVGYVWGLYYLFRLIDAFPRVDRRLGIVAAIAIGFALSVRIGGLLLLCYLVLAIVACIVRYAWIRRDAEATYRYASRTILHSLAVTAGAWAVMLVWWPWAMFDPIRRPLAALTRMSEFIDHRRYMPFAGEEVYNLDPPWDYLLHYFAFKLPEYVVVAFVITSFVGIGTLVTGGLRRLPFNRALQLSLLGLAIWFPPIYAVYKGSPLYDGLRHFLFLVPPICVVVALVLDGLIDDAKKRWGARGGHVAAAFITVLVADQATTLVRYHPHQYVYFNRFIGGLEGAVGQYSTDYYAEAYREAARGLAKKLWEDDPEGYLDSMYRVGGCVGKFRALSNLPPNFGWKVDDEPFDFDIGYTRDDCHLRRENSPELLRVERDGGLLTMVRDLREQIVPREELKALRDLEREQKRREKKKKKKGRKKRPKKPSQKPKKPGVVGAEMEAKTP